MGVKTVLLLFFVISLVQNINSSAGNVERQKKRNYNTWTSEMDAQIAGIHRNINTREPGYFEKVKTEWFKLHPNSEISNTALYNRYLRISHQIERDGKRPKRNFDWNKEKYDDLVDAYLTTRPYNQYSSVELDDEWRRRHQDSPNYGISYLSSRARHWIEKQKLDVQEGQHSKCDFKWDNKKKKEIVQIYLNTYPYNESHPVGISDEWANRHPEFPKFNNSYLAGRAREYSKKYASNVKKKPFRRLFEWTNRHDSDLYHIYHVTLSKGKRQPVYMHKVWTDLHSDLKELTHNQMMERMVYLRKNKPDQHFPWTNEQNQELLRIYHNTDPGLANQGQRIHEIWSKIHPRYSFMTPYYLQVHASTLAFHEKGKDHDKKRRNKFTVEQKANSVDMYRRLTKPHKTLYDFHEAWVRKYPSLAYITPKVIASHIRRWMAKEDSSSEDVAEGEQQFELRQYRRRNNHKYTPEEKAELIEIFYQTDPERYGHSERILKRWIERHGDAKHVSGKILRMTIQGWIRQDRKNKGKEPMLNPKAEVEAESFSTDSDMSQ